MPKKRGENPLFRALSSSLIQRYNIFCRNPNLVNTSQHSTGCPFAAICSRRGLISVILRGRDSSELIPFNGYKEISADGGWFLKNIFCNFADLKTNINVIQGKCMVAVLQTAARFMESICGGQACPRALHLCPYLMARPTAAGTVVRFMGVGLRVRPFPSLYHAVVRRENHLNLLIT